MTREEVLVLHEQLTAKGREIMKGKSHDYSKEHWSQNFRTCEAIGLCSSEQGILVRITDKVSRMASLLTKEAKVKDESFEDTAVDLINYVILLLALRKENNEGQMVGRPGVAADFLLSRHITVPAPSVSELRVFPTEPL